jgi:hypothetical protein
MIRYIDNGPQMALQLYYGQSCNSTQALGLLLEFVNLLEYRG